MEPFVSEYQTLIVGAVGFAGVILTLAFNAFLARRQHNRQVRHEARIVRVALYAELEAIAESYRERIRTLDDPGPHGGMIIPLDTMTDVYKTMVGRVGLLSSFEVRAVLRAYLLVLQLPDRIKFLADETHATEPGFAYIPARMFTPAMQMHRNYLEDIDAAIAALKA